MLVSERNPPAPKAAPAVAAAGSLDRVPVLCFATDEASEQALRGGLADLMDGIQFRRGDIAACIRLLEREGTPRVLVADVSGQADPLAALDQLAAVCTPDMRLLAVGERTDVGFYRTITRDLGAAEYLYKPLTRDTVASLFGPHLQGVGKPAAQQDRGGRVITVCGARGGAGATTIAVNLAVRLSEQTRGHVALLDLHLRRGTAPMMLGLQPGAGLRVALEQPERADELFLDRAAIPFNDRLRVLGAAEPFDSEPAITEAGIERLIAQLRSRFNTILVDMPLPPTGPERHVLMASRINVVVLTPDLASVRDAVSAQQLTTRLNGANRTLMVLNRSTMAGALTPALVREALGAEPHCVIPELAALPRSANLGKPAIHTCPPFSRALAPLAMEVSGQAVPSPARIKRLLGLRR